MHISKFNSKCGLSLRGYASPLHLLSHWTKFLDLVSLYSDSADQCHINKIQLELKALLWVLEKTKWTELIKPSVTHTDTSLNADTCRWISRMIQQFSHRSLWMCTCVCARCMRKTRTEMKKDGCLFISVSPALCQLDITRTLLKKDANIFTCARHMQMKPFFVLRSEKTF